MMGHQVRHHVFRRPIALAGLFLIALAIALLLGRWLAVAQAPLTRQVVAQKLLEGGDAAHRSLSPCCGRFRHR